ncbi:MAG: type II secretion system F family protein [Candidatus Pacearchaeota archaeon]|nr:type II secretion system F family protein [Candidatus Pacearchaeota archaeon]
MIDDLRRNIDKEIKMTAELNKYFDRSLLTQGDEKRIYLGLVKSLINQIKILNNVVPDLLNISLASKLTPPSVELPLKEENYEFAISGKGKDEFLKELNISENLINKLKKRDYKKEKNEEIFKKPNLYGKFANKFFLDFSEKLIKKGKLKALIFNVRRSNMNILGATYISMMLFSLVVAFLIGVLVFIFFIFFEVSFAVPFINSFDGNYLIRTIKLLWIPFMFSLVSFIGFYSYPGAEKSALGKRIDSELPFVVIHMGSISGSGIEPLEILKIIATSKEYKYAGMEVRKLINQTNVYGYDLSTALRNVAHTTPSVKFAELLNGIGVTINSGGGMQNFFEKRAESLLLEYRLEREKSTKTSETFMDLYISIVIATPMILLMVLMMVAVSGIKTGFSPQQMTIAIIGIVTIINILFLTFLHLKQPAY